jgi:hypothetical protein
LETKLTNHRIERTLFERKSLAVSVDRRIRWFVQNRTRALLSISSEMSAPTTKPALPTICMAIEAASPVPDATSST